VVKRQAYRVGGEFVSKRQCVSELGRDCSRAKQCVVQGSEEFRKDSPATALDHVLKGNGRLCCKVSSMPIRIGAVGPGAELDTDLAVLSSALGDFPETSLLLNGSAAAP
jgi:hypothetical protein